MRKSAKAVTQIGLEMLPHSDHSASLESILYLDDNFLPPQMPDASLELGSDNLIDISPRFPYKPMFTFVLFILEGSVHARINLTDYSVGPGDVLLCQSGIIVDVLKITPDIKTGVIAFDQDALLGGNTDESFLILQRRVIRPSIFHLEEQQMGMLQSIYQMTRGILKMDDFMYRRDAAGGLMRILTAALAQWTQNRRDNLESSSKKRRENLFIRFLHDVQAYCATERRIGFYSSRFNMTPKYFAKQINEISGRHASDWIRDHVILEAKAMLRTGNYSVGEVSDALHFPNSSFFGKYFKASVGVSPRQYMTQEK